MDERPGISMVFYNVIQSAAYFGKPNMLPFIACRMVQLTMEKGLCKYSIMGFVYYAWALWDMQDASRIGKAAMNCWEKRYRTTEKLPNLYLVYYGFVAFHTEPLRVGTFGHRITGERQFNRVVDIQGAFGQRPGCVDTARCRRLGFFPSGQPTTDSAHVLGLPCLEE